MDFQSFILLRIQECSLKNGDKKRESEIDASLFSHTAVGPTPGTFFDFLSSMIGGKKLLTGSLKKPGDSRRTNRAKYGEMGT